MSESATRELLGRIEELQNLIYERMDYRERSQPSPPATEEQIREVETILRCILPEAYRSFLLVNNGWEHWSGDVALLSTEQMLRGQYAQRVAEWKKKERMRRNRLVVNSLVVGFSLFVGEQILIDLSSNTGAEVVTWDKGEEQRFADFFAYLLNFEAILREELANTNMG